MSLALSPSAVRWRCIASALPFPLVSLAADFLARGTGPFTQRPWIWALSVAWSVGLWMSALEVARDRRRAVRVAALVLIAVIAAFGVGLQAIVFRLTHAYLGPRALILALGIPNLARSSYLTRGSAPMAALALAGMMSVALLARLRARWLGHRARRRAAAGLVVALLVTAFAPLPNPVLSQLPPDVLLLHALGAPVEHLLGLRGRPKTLPVGRHAHPSPAATPSASRPSIVLIVGESLRRDAICARPGDGVTGRTPSDPGCTPSPEIDRAAPDRIGFQRAFSTASCTELATMALWTGLAQTAPVDAQARAPLLWDWAKAEGYRTAYVTSQNLLFQQSDAFLRGSQIDVMREARDFAIDAAIDDGSPDELLTDVAVDFVRAAKEPFFLVVHHANTHAPYRVSDGEVPPSDAWDRYQASLARNDRVVGELVRRLRAVENGKLAVVIYLSDHGEAFGEHGGYYHSFDLHAEQVDVPLWFDVPPGSVPETVRRRLAGRATSAPTAIVDVTATVMDLMGTMSLGGLAGVSLVREDASVKHALLWNCPPTRECPAEAFAVVAFPWKLQWVGTAQRYECDDLEADPRELSPAPLARCSHLEGELDAAFGGRRGTGLAR